jgi:hypothetical protein
MLHAYLGVGTVTNHALGSERVRHHGVLAEPRPVRVIPRPERADTIHVRRAHVQDHLHSPS